MLFRSRNSFSSVLIIAVEPASEFFSIRDAKKRPVFCSVIYAAQDLEIQHIAKVILHHTK